MLPHIFSDRCNILAHSVTRLHAVSHQDMVKSLIAMGADNGGTMPTFPAWNSDTGAMIAAHNTMGFKLLFMLNSRRVFGWDLWHQRWGRIAITHLESRSCTI